MNDSEEMEKRLGQMKKLPRRTRVALINTQNAATAAIRALPENTEAIFIDHLMNGNVITVLCHVRVGKIDMPVPLKNIRVINPKMSLEKRLELTSDECELIGDEVTRIFKDKPRWQKRVIFQEMQRRDLLEPFIRRMVGRDEVSSMDVMVKCLAPSDPTAMFAKALYERRQQDSE
jgi:hypothetical protein